MYFPSLPQMSTEDKINALLFSHAAVVKRIDHLTSLYVGRPTPSLPAPNASALMSHDDQVQAHVYPGPFKVYLLPLCLQHKP
jgi:hypothetical protein